jgi:DHA1 family inner membrane transport protein
MQTMIVHLTCFSRKAPMTTSSPSPAPLSHWIICVFPLVLGTFAIGSEGLIIAGILPDVARGLHVSISTAGQLVTIFALAYAILGPFLVAAATRFPVRRVLLGSLSVFTLGCAFVALAPSYGIMVVSRIVVAIGAASFRAVATATGAALAPSDKRGRALALVGSGFTIASVVSVPLGTLLAGLTSWRIAFALVAVLGGLAVIGIATLVPNIDRPPVVTIQMFGRLLRRPALLVIVTTTLLAMAGDYVFYTYFAPFTLLLTHGGEPALALALFIIGISSVVGIALGGTSADRFGVHRTIVVSTIVLLIALLGLWALSITPVTTMTMLLDALAFFIWGGAGLGIVIPLQSLLLTTVPDQSVVTLALNSSGSLFGIALGGAVGGLIVNSQIEFLPLGAGIFVVLGLLLYLSTVGSRRTSTRSSAAARIDAPMLQEEKM